MKSLVPEAPGALSTADLNPRLLCLESNKLPTEGNLSAFTKLLWVFKSRKQKHIT